MFDEDKADRGFGLPLSEQSKERLGVVSQQSVRVVGRAGRTILLECDGGDGPAVPWDRDLVLSVDVRSFPLADLLELIHGMGKSGFLLFQHGSEEKAVYLNRGEVVFAESNLPSDRLGACLLRSGALTGAQLELAERRYHPLTRFGKVVVELGLLTPRDLWNGVRMQVEEIVRSLFSFHVGWIHFWEGEVEPANVVRLSLPTRRLIEEGLERRDGLLRFLGLLENPRTRILRSSKKPHSETSEVERSILHALQSEHAFPAICHRTGLDPRTAARALQFLQLTGFLTVEQAVAAEGDFDAADDDVVREAVTLHAKLIDELAAPLVALEGTRAVSERLNRVLEEGAAHRGLLDGICFSPQASLDPTAIEYRALRLPGDRVRQVDETLGELVAYLEFELKNHPQIDDPAAFLEAVAPLRAMLAR